MKKNIVKDVLFLGQKSEEATPEDRTLALDLQDTLNAHLLECVGLAANMIGVKKRAIIIRMGSENLVLFNPLNYFWIVEQDAVVEWALLR